MMPPTGLLGSCQIYTLSYKTMCWLCVCDDLNHFVQISAYDLDLKDYHGQSLWPNSGFKPRSILPASVVTDPAALRKLEGMFSNFHTQTAQLCPHFLSLSAPSLITITASNIKKCCCWNSKQMVLSECLSQDYTQECFRFVSTSSHSKSLVECMKFLLSHFNRKTQSAEAVTFKVL